MKLTLPPLLGIDAKFVKGSVKQLKEASRTLEAHMTRFTLPSALGWMFETDEGEVLYVFHRLPVEAQLPSDGALLVGNVPEAAEEIDLQTAKWIPRNASIVDNSVAVALDSWRNAFRYIREEEAGSGKIGLRKPQIGALHAIHAHWSTASSVATVVMPTGIGKTETMLATLVTARCPRLLVLVPTDALRRQIAEKFYSLGILKHPDCVVLDQAAIRPVVGTLLKLPSTPDEVDEFFSQCNVIVTTSALAGLCSPDAQDRMAEQCSHLFIDEAHHAEAPTWKQFKSHFKARERPILQFTATPFREDGLPLDGKIGDCLCLLAQIGSA